MSCTILFAVISITEVIALVLFNLGTGFSLGWFVSEARRRYLWRTAARRQEENSHSSAEENRRLLDNISWALVRHAAQLASFRVLLYDSQHVACEEVRKNLRMLDAATSELEQTLSESAVRLARVMDTFDFGETRIASHLAVHRRHAANFRRLSTQWDTSDTVEALRDMLVQPIGELLETKRQLELELASAKQHIAEQAVQLEEAHLDARIDSLTKLPNRRAFDERVTETHSLFERQGQPYSLLLFDIDSFKELNDTHGHATGDAALAVLGHVLREVARASDHVSRIGGEEFAMLLPSTSLQRAFEVAERFRMRIENTVIHSKNFRLTVTVSAGVTEARPGLSWQQVLAQADSALYAAKGCGRNQTHINDGETISEPVQLARRENTRP